MASADETLTFTLSNEDLAFVIEELQKHLPATLHPVAWRILKTEQERRAATKQTHPLPAPVEMSVAIFKQLPASIRARLSNYRDPGPSNSAPH